jgi:hypothetical protein
MAQTQDKEPLVSYPANQVAGTFAEAAPARAAIEALVAAGVEPREVVVLHGEDGLRRLDAGNHDHGVVATVRETLLRIGATVEEHEQLRHHLEDVRAGRFVIMAPARDAAARTCVSDILTSQGATFVVSYGRWAIETKPD